VKKWFQRVTPIFVVAVVFGIVCSGSLLQAQQSSPDSQQPQSQNPPDQQTPPPSSNEPSQQAPDRSGQQAAPDAQAPSQESGATQTFTGTVMKQGDKYVFQDDATGTTYDIDRQEEVKKFEGKKVRVHGTLDANKKMIHVQ
jgi:uncharacterized protein YdeI (BOF family)